MDKVHKQELPKIHTFGIQAEIILKSLLFVDGENFCDIINVV